MKTRPSVDPKVYDLAEAFIESQIDEKKRTMEAELDIPDNLCSRLVRDKEDNTWNLAGDIQTVIENFLEGLES